MNADADADANFTQYDCYRNIIDTYHTRCGRNDYDLKFFGNFAAFCQYNGGLNAADLVANMC